jgi:hypothetical protein
MTTIDVARSLRLPMFPCVSTPGNTETHKTPLTRHGFKDAVTDPAMIRDWWSRYPNALIGVPTGSASGIFVIDIDSAKHHTAAQWLDAADLPETRQHRTQSGGLHLLFKHCSLGSSGSRLARGVDTRGEGGYIIWWPAEGHQVIEAELAAVPGWIIEAFKPAPAKVVPTQHLPSWGRGQAGADIRLRGIIGRVAGARPNCERNSLTFWAACRIRDMIALGELDHSEGAQAFAILAAASSRTGLSDREIMTTIASAAARA